MVTIRQQLVGDTTMKFAGTNPKRYLTIHETGNTSAGANAAAHANLQSRRWDWATWHWTVDAREAVQSYSNNLRLWHAGDGQGHGNMSSIGIEICVNSDMSRATARQNAAELAAHILTTEGIPLANMVQHNHWSGKNCPMFIRREGRWGEFINLVRAAMGGKPGPAPKPTPAPGKQTTAQVAAAVYAGDYGNEPQRSVRLRDAGYDPAVIQAEVNRRYYGGSAPAPAPSGGGSLAHMALRTYRGDFGNEPGRSAKIRAAGFDPAAVQAEVNRIYYGGGGSAPAPAPAPSSNLAAVAAQVYAGEFGNEPQRSQRLRAAGHDPVAVQAEVNRRYYGGGGAAPAAPSKKSNVQIAREIVFGEGHGGRNPWGNDPQRSQRLRAAGYDPAAVQREVNRLA